MQLLTSVVAYISLVEVGKSQESSYFPDISRQVRLSHPLPLL